MTTFLSRRNFIRLSGVAAGSFMFQPKVDGNTPITQKTGDKSGEIIYRTLGRTGLKLPVVSMGAMRSDNPGLITAAIKEGILHLDTAHGYQNGRNEEMLGELLKDTPRDSFIIATKIHPRGKESSIEEFNEKFELSLKRLKMDYVDILYLHGVSNKDTMMYENHLTVLENLKKQGKVRFTGVSTHQNMPDVIQAVIDSNFYDIVLTSYNFRMNNIEEMNSAIEKAAKAGIGIIGMKSMAGVFWDKEKTKPINTRAALKWVLQNENIHTTIPGCTTYDELAANLEIMRDITMTEQEKNDLVADDAMTGIFCTGCGTCILQCRKKLPIPDIMRAYMYAYGYKDLSLAREVLDEKNINGNPCDECETCTVQCLSGFNIAQKTSDISRIKSIPVEFLA